MDDVTQNYRDVEREVAHIVASQRRGETLPHGQKLKAAIWKTLVQEASPERISRVEADLKKEGATSARTLAARLVHLRKSLFGGYAAEALNLSRAKVLKKYAPAAESAAQIDASEQRQKERLAALRQAEASFNENAERRRREQVAEATVLKENVSVSRPLRLKVNAST